MYYYAMLDANNFVSTTIPSETQIIADTMIEISEEQYNSGDLVGKYYDSTTGQFIDPSPSVLAELSTEEINHGEVWLSDFLDNISSAVVPQKVKKFPPTFTNVNYNPGARMYDCAYGNNLYVMVGENGKIVTSPDAVTWTDCSISDVTDDFYYIAYGNNMFVAAGTNGLMYKSTDGNNWTSISGFTKDVISLVYGDGVFARLGTCETNTSLNAVTISTDGVTWTQVYTSATVTCLTFVDFDPYYRKPQFVGIGSGGITIYGWEGGTDWGLSYAQSENTYYSIAYGNSSYVACDDTKIYHSPDGLIWETIGDFRTSHLHGVYFHDGVFYIPCHNGYVLVSKNGYDWKYSRTSIMEYVDFLRIYNGKMITSSQYGNVTVDDPYENKTLAEVIESL